MAFMRYAAQVLAGVLGYMQIGWDGGDPVSIGMRSLDNSQSRFPIDAAVKSDDLVRRHMRSWLRIGIPLIAGRELGREHLQGLFDHSDEPSLEQVEDDHDFRFCYPIPPGHQPKDLSDYCLKILRCLLDVVDVLDSRGKAIHPISLRLGQSDAPIPAPDPLRHIDLGPRVEFKSGQTMLQPLSSIAATEPAIVVLAEHLALIIRMSDIPDLRKADGLCLRRASDWIVPSSGHPSIIYEYLARVCNVSCKFCYLYGNPTGLATARGIKVIDQLELDTRIRYYNPINKTSLLQSQWELNEFLVDPKLESTLRRIRNISSDPCYFITNGNPLTEKKIEFLSSIKPVHVIVSINNLDIPLRSSIMREGLAQSRTSIGSLRLLSKYEIPFGVSLVALPDFSFSSLERTLQMVDQECPAFIRLNLPGFTREHPYRVDFDTNAYWKATVQWAMEQRRKLRSPMFTIPSAFEENHFHEDPNSPRIIGTVPNSPAERAGLKAGDVIVGIGDLRIKYRSELLAVLMLVRKIARLTVIRNESQITVDLVTGNGSYPFVGHVISKYIFPHGIVASGSISPEDIRYMSKLIRENNINESWVATSEIMRPAVRDIIQKIAPDVSNKVRCIIPDNKFLGGNIRIMDMATVSDIAESMSCEFDKLPRPSGIFLPSTGFNKHGRDIAGRPVQDLEKWLGVPIFLLNKTQRFPF
jgi:hypothetical protein